MRRKYRVAWWTVAIVLLIGVLAFSGATAFVDSDWAAQYALRKLASVSGNRVQVATLTMRMQTALRIDMTQLRVVDSKPYPDLKQNPAEAGQDLLHAESAVFRISVLPLLIGRIRLASAEMSGVRLLPGRHEGGDEGPTLHLSGRAGDLSDMGKPGASTSFALRGEVEGHADAGNIGAEGRVGLAADLIGTDVRVHAEAPAKSPLPAAIGIRGGALASVALDAAMHERNGDLEIDRLAFSLDDFHATGQGVVRLNDSPPHIEGRLRTDYLDWKKTAHDAGLPTPPEKPRDAVVRDFRVAWPLLQRINGFTANLGVQLGVWKLRSGIPLNNVDMQLQLQAGQMRVPAFSADVLGGKMKADAVFIVHDQRIKLNLKASGISIEQWRAALHKPLMLTNGPLAVDANVSATGASMHKLAATLTGPVILRMGRAVVRSSGVSGAETLFTGLIPALAGKRAEHMEVVCVVARLPFKDGRATSSAIAGARTVSSQLLTDGDVNLRDQTLNLHGRVTGIDGTRLGASMLIDEVNIGGKLVKPTFRLDARGVVGTAARIGAAILSFGLTAAGTALWDANADNACQVAGQNPKNKPPAAGELAIPQ